jgi:arsenate reductase
MKIIVLCTGNSCRSQIAEGLLKSKYPDYEIHSAGTKPEINVNPYAIRAMKDSNIDISNNYPKLVDDLLTVCDSANEICPTFHNAKNKIHNSFEDPSKDSYESDEHAMEIYNQTVKDISNWIEQLEF